ncbi:MAG: type VI secretion system tip protein VgrG [Polyangiaceae bacterium]|nr:type VI secretion system tip protein VgrG [Polyangiaceae bacterium]
MLARLLDQPFCPALRIEVDSGEELDVRDFSVQEALSTLFYIHLTVVAPTADVDIEAIVGKAARFTISATPTYGAPDRAWDGVCNHMELLRVEEDGLSTYRLVLVPRLWLLSQRRNYRIFQHLSEPRIVERLLEEWEIAAEFRIAEDEYKPRKYRVQYAESDFAFLSRLLEDAGITYFFEQRDDETKLVIADRVHANERRPVPIPFIDSTMGRSASEFVTAVRVAHRVRPGRYTLRDVDYRRRSDFPLAATARADNEGIEARLERFHFTPGAFLFGARSSGDTPTADDQGAARTDLEAGQRQANLRLEAKRSSAKVITLVTNVAALAPGVVFTIGGHPRSELSSDKTFFTVATTIEGDTHDPWMVRCEVRPTTAPFRPPLSTPKPITQGVETAVVVGPAGEEIHTDEFGRVRVQFHWDREGARNERSSCWLPVSQAWGGAGFGAVNLPRIGQEVLVDFLQGDPDRPVVVGRVFTRNQPTPYALPAHRAVTGIRSESTPRGRPTPARAAPGPRSSPLGGGQGMDEGAIDDAATTPSPFRAQSPSGTTHRWSGSEITFRDTAGSELVYLQAQRDLHMLAKNDRVAVVGNNDATRVAADRLVRIGNSDDLEIEQNRTVRIGGKWTSTVEKDIEVQSVTGSETHHIAELFAVGSKELVLAARQQMIFQVGQSAIILRPDFIMIEAPHVFINPGASVAEAVLAGGDRPETPAEHDARVAQEAANRAQRENLGVRPYDPAARPQGRSEQARAVLNQSQQRAQGTRLPADTEREYFDDILTQRGFNEGERREAIEQWLRDNPRSR